MSVFVVPDAHGNHALVLGLLEQEGIVGWSDGEQQRAAGKDITVVQLGDLANCVGASIADDRVALSLVGPVIDFMLVGNHEHPYFGGPPFSGFWPDAEVRRDVLRLHDSGLVRAAHAVDGILITHAGIVADFAQLFLGADAEDAARYLNGLWENGIYDALIFSRIGHSRGGMHEYGGVLWSDWHEPKLQTIPQVFGHTVGDDVRREGTAICLDLGGGKGSTRLAGAWIRDGEVQVIEYDVALDTGAEQPLAAERTK